MRQLLPRPVDDPDIPAVVGGETRVHPTGRPWVFTNLVVALDGGIEIGGLSAPLSSDADRLLFRALRSASDVVVVGASTARLERYRLPVVIDANGPRLCVVSGSLDLDPSLPFLDHGLRDEASWPVIVTGTRLTDAHRHRFEHRATLIEVADGAVRPDQVLATLAELGLQRVLCEGGPGLLGQFATSGLIDEWNLSISPVFAGPTSARLNGSTAQEPHSPPSPLTLDRLFVDGSHLFARYLKP